MQKVKRNDDLETRGPMGDILVRKFDTSTMTPKKGQGLYLKDGAMVEVIANEDAVLAPAGQRLVPDNRVVQCTNALGLSPRIFRHSIESVVVFEACRVRIDVDLPVMDSREDRLVQTRALLLRFLDDRVLRGMSRLYVGEEGKIDLENSQARFKVRSQSEVAAIVQARVAYLDGYPDRDSTHLVGTVTAEDHLAAGRKLAIGWWRKNIERFDNVERVSALVSIVDEDGTVGACDLTAERVIFENGKEK